MRVVATATGDVVGSEGRHDSLLRSDGRSAAPFGPAASGRPAPSQKLFTPSDGRGRSQAASTSIVARSTGCRENQTGSGLRAPARRIGLIADSRSSRERNGVIVSSPSGVRMSNPMPGFSELAADRRQRRTPRLLPPLRLSRNWTRSRDWDWGWDWDSTLKSHDTALRLRRGLGRRVWRRSLSGRHGRSRRFLLQCEGRLGLGRLGRQPSGLAAQLRQQRIDRRRRAAELASDLPHGAPLDIHEQQDPRMVLFLDARHLSPRRLVANPSPGREHNKNICRPESSVKLVVERLPHLIGQAAAVVRLGQHAHVGRGRAEHGVVARGQKNPKPRAQPPRLIGKLHPVP